MAKESDMTIESVLEDRLKALTREELVTFIRDHVEGDVDVTCKYT